MLPSDITVVANRSAVTLPGTTASAVYKTLPALSTSAGTVVRRVTGTQGTHDERKLFITQQTVRPGKDSERTRTVVGINITDNTALIGNSTLRPTASVTVTIDRATGPGAVTAIDDNQLTDALAQALDVVLQQRASLLNGEN